MTFDPTITVVRGEAREHSLLVIEDGRSRHVDIPIEASWIVGRADDAQLQLPHASVSRHHAEIENSPTGLRVRDAGSRNGVIVNGVTVTGWRTLHSRDVVEIGEVTLILRPIVVSPSRSALEPDALISRLRGEVGRAQTSSGEIAVVAVSTEGALDERLGVILEACEADDIVGWTEDGLVVVIRLGSRVNVQFARSLEERLAASEVPGVGIGIAHMPTDAVDASALVAVARDAASIEGGGVNRGSAVAMRIAIGGKTIVVADAAMRHTYALLRRLAAVDISVVITGETGVGKENAARAVHQWSSRCDKPFVAVNCAALAESVVESELFGHAAGSFSGATGDRVGYIESADGGTLFLDELGELPMAIQAKLLRALDNGEIVRVGETAPRVVNVRLVGATNRDLEAEVAAGRFRRDLLYRLAAANVTIPPLRERTLEVALLAELFLRDACDRHQRVALELSNDALIALAKHSWPGNIRELRNAMDYASATADDGSVRAWHLPAGIGLDKPNDVEEPAFKPLADELAALEERRIREALEATNGVKKRAAELLGMPRRTFTMKLQRYGIT